MSLTCYVFTCAEDKQNARSDVDYWLEEYSSREFYDDYVIEDVVHYSEITAEYLDKEMANTLDWLDRQREEAEKCRATGDREGEGWAMQRAANILLEQFCSSMPWFNKETGDWALPDRDGRLCDKQDNWWAVRVRFHD